MPDSIIRHRSPRALLVTGAYFPEFSAGGLQCQAVAAVLRDRADLVVLTTATDATLRRHETVAGVAVSRVIVNPGHAWSAVRGAIVMLIELVRLLPHVDLVHIQGFSSKNIVISAMAKLFARPVVLHLQTAKHDEPAAVRGQGRLAWWAFRSADRHLSVSQGLTRGYLESGLPAGRVCEIPNGVDAARFSPASDAERQSLRRQLHLPEDRPIVLFVGVMMPDKQPHVLLDAWLQMRRASGIVSTLVFVGASNPKLYELGDRLAERVRTTADESGFGSDVLFVPPTSSIEDYFRAADVFVMPSAREGLPIVLLEAMACGLPVVASHLPGSTDTIIEPGVNGLLAPPGEAAGFAAGLGRVLANPVEGARLGVAARQTVEARYTIEHVAGRWLDAYQQLLASR